MSCVLGVWVWVLGGQSLEKVLEKEFFVDKVYQLVFFGVGVSLKFVVCKELIGERIIFFFQGFWEMGGEVFVIVYEVRVVFVKGEFGRLQLFFFRGFYFEKLFLVWIMEVKELWVGGGVGTD